MLKDQRNLKATLRKLTELIVQEAERNQDFARQLTDVLGLTQNEIPSREKRGLQDVEVDPFEALREKGADGFRGWLNSLSIDALRSIVRQHRLDSSRLSDRWKTKERFVDLICERVNARSRHGESFRHYGKDSKDPMVSGDNTLKSGDNGD